jgi:hypothetical protein
VTFAGSALRVWAAAAAACPGPTSGALRQLSCGSVRGSERQQRERLFRLSMHCMELSCCAAVHCSCGQHMYRPRGVVGSVLCVLHHFPVSWLLDVASSAAGTLLLYASDRVFSDHKISCNCTSESKSQSHLLKSHVLKCNPERLARCSFLRSGP